jgi:hypothetical protein
LCVDLLHYLILPKLDNEKENLRILSNKEVYAIVKKTTSTAKRNSRYNRMDQCSRKRVGCSCGENGGQVSQRLPEIIVHRECAAEADQRNDGRKVST